MSHVQVIICCLLLITVFVNEAGCNGFVNPQQKGDRGITNKDSRVQYELEEMKRELKETKNALSELIITLLKSKDDSGDTEQSRDNLIRRRRDISDEGDDILSRLPISSLLGLRGRDGSNGKDGRDGRDGKDGDGKDGRDGKDGLNGEPGEIGRDGRNGKDGDGKDGRDGAPGDDGVPGEQGKSGEKGEKGDSGSNGLAGPPGVQGQVGRTGAPGKDGTAGRNGAVGESGERGNYGAPGQKGDSGDKGSSGQEGRPGPKGNNGKNGTAGQPGEKGSPGRTLESIGTVYTRWGRTVCGNQSNLIYSGFAAGSRSDQTGGGVNYQCMPPTPEYNSYSSGGAYSTLSGAEYETYSYGIFPSQAFQKNVPCAQCYTNTRPAAMMLPAKRTCPSGWTREYEGYLMTGYHGSTHPSTFECVDAHPEYIAGSESNLDGALFYFVKPICSGYGDIGHCSSQQYMNDRQLTCVVCSK